jgi:hypothetical protein
MVKAGEELAEIRVEHPVHVSRLDPSRERVQRIVWTTPRPEPVREAEKVRRVDRIQHLDHRPLQDLVLQHGNTERPQPPVWRVIANWDGKQRSAEASIQAARKASIRPPRQTSGRGVDALANSKDSSA